MYVIICSESDRSGIVAILGPWRFESEAQSVSDTLEVFGIGRIFEVYKLAPVIHPPTVE